MNGAVRYILKIIRFFAYLIIMFSCVKVCTFILTSCILVWMLLAVQFPDLVHLLGYYMSWQAVYISMAILGLVMWLVKRIIVENKKVKP